MKVVWLLLWVALVGACGQDSPPDSAPADAGPPVYSYFYIRGSGGGAEVVLGSTAGDVLDVRQLDGAVASVSAAVSPDQSQVAFESYDDAAKAWALIVRPLFGSAADEHVVDHASVAGTERWSPDSKRLAYASGGAVYVVDAAGGTPAQIGTWSAPGSTIGDTTATCTPLAWSPDSSSLAFSTCSGLAVYDLASSQAKTLLPTGTAGWICSPAWSPDGQTIAFGQSDPTNINHLESIPAVGGVESLVALLVSSSGQSQWSPDSRKIAYVDYNDGDDPSGPAGPVLRVIDVGAGTAPRILDGLNVGITAGHPQWSPDGGTLLYVVLDAVSDARLSTISAPGGVPNPLPLVGAAVDSTDPAWLSPPIVK